MSQARIGMPFVIGIAGGSGSGKTTFARALAQELGDRLCAVIAQDNYYVDQSAIFRGDGENVNFDHPGSLDFDLLAHHLSDLAERRGVDLPLYDFASHKRLTHTQRLEPHGVIIVDGILILSQPKIRAQLHASLFIETPEAIRFERRTRRDQVERGRSLEGIQKQIARQVKPMHDQFVEPSKAFATEILSGTDDFTPHVERWARKLRQIAG